MSGRPSDLQVRLHYASNRFGMGKSVVGIESLLDEAAETIAALEADRLAALAPVTAGATVNVDELARDVHYAICDDGLAPLSPVDNNVLRSVILRVLRLRLGTPSREQGEGS